MVLDEESDAQRPAPAGTHLVTLLPAEDLDGGPGQRSEGYVDLGSAGALDPASVDELIPARGSGGSRVELCHFVLGLLLPTANRRGNGADRAAQAEEALVVPGPQPTGQIARERRADPVGEGRVVGSSSTGAPRWARRVLANSIASGSAPSSMLTPLMVPTPMPTGAFRSAG